MEQLRPIFEALRQREELPCSYPLHVGSTHGTKQAFIYGHSRSQGSTTPGAHHYTHHHGYQPSPGYHWVMLTGYLKKPRLFAPLISTIRLQLYLLFILFNVYVIVYVVEPFVKSIILVQHALNLLLLRKLRITTGFIYALRRDHANVYLVRVRV